MVDASEMQKERERLEARNREIDDMFLSLYTDKIKGVISEQRVYEVDHCYGAGARRKSVPVAGTDANASAI